MKKSLALLLVLVLTATSLIIIAKPAVSSVETVEDSWSTKTSLPQVEGGVRAAVVDGKIHVIGGSVHYVYDPVKNDWISKKPMPNARQYFGIAVYQNRIYTIGGSWWDPDLGRVTSNVNEVYDSVTDSWETKTSMPTNRSDLCASIVDGKVYLIGGRTGGSSSIVALNEVYDVANNSWTTKKSVHYPVDSYASAVVDGKIYVIGGFEGLYHGVPVGYTQIYDPLMDKWSLGSSISNIVRNAAAGATTGLLASKRIYVMGGGQDMVATNYTQVYNPENDSWSMAAQMPTIRGWLAVAVVNDLLYAIGGAPYLTASFVTTNEQYTPLGYTAPDLSNDVTAPVVSPVVLVAAVSIVVIVAGAGLLVYFKKRKG
jgi:N-acetylneuraminic acid mutarotase